MKKSLLISVSIFLAIFLIIYFICGLTYSEGNRAGYLVKISKKGYIFKTYEGQLNVNPFGGAAGSLNNGNVWEFSVSNAATFEELQKHEGKKVSLHYHQVLKNLFWQGDTQYFVDGVELVD